MPTVPEHAELARAAARRLAPELDPGLEMQVERVLAIDDRGSPPAHFEAVGIDIASLVVSVAALAWPIYRDLKADRERARKPAAREAVARNIRLRVELPAGVTPAQRDRVIETVLQELDRRE